MQHDRSAFLGSSDTPAILGVSPWRSPLQCYLEKTGEWREEITPEKQRVFDRGHRWEPVVLEMLLDEMRGRGHSVEVVARNQRRYDPEHPFLTAEIDAEILLDGEDMDVEIKTVHPFAAGSWGEDGSDEIPIYYSAQVQHGLMVRLRRRTLVAALIGVDDLRIHWVDRNDEIIAAIRERLLAFWQRVQDRNPPPPTSDADIRILYPRDAGEVVEADASVWRLCEDLRNLKDTAKRIKSDIDATEVQIKAAMGNAATLASDGKPLATWRNNKDSKVVDWQAAYSSLNPPEEYEKEFTTTKPGARPFILKI